MYRHHVIPAQVFNIQKLILCRDFGQRDDLDAVLFAVERIHKQVTEVAWANGVFHGPADIVYVPTVLRCVGHVYDKARFGRFYLLWRKINPTGEWGGEK